MDYRSEVREFSKSRDGVSLLNLNNEVFGFYQGSPRYQIQREFYNRTVSAGVRVTR